MGVRVPAFELMLLHLGRNRSTALASGTMHGHGHGHGLTTTQIMRTSIPLLFIICCYLNLLLIDRINGPTGPKLWILQCNEHKQPA